jgi:hypothetical protein
VLDALRLKLQGSSSIKRKARRRSNSIDPGDLYVVGAKRPRISRSTEGKLCSDQTTLDNAPSSGPYSVFEFSSNNYYAARFVNSYEIPPASYQRIISPIRPGFADSYSVTPIRQPRDVSSSFFL